MATVTYYPDFATEPGTGSVTTADSTHIVVSFDQNFQDYYFGNFTYSNSAVTGGTINVVEESHGHTIWSVSDVGLPAAPYFSSLFSGDGTAAAKYLLSGNDSLQGSTSGEVIAGLGGNDTVIALDGNDTVDGGDGNDDVNGNKGDDIVFGGAGADTVRGGQGNDSIFGGDGDDPHVNGNIGDDSVFGGNGNDTVYGGQGNDTLHGDAGNDLLSGDLGNDILYGDAGADRFTIARNGGFDWVADFKPSEGDVIQLAPGTAYTVTSVSGQVVIDLGGGDELGLAGVPAGSFSSSWIVYG